MNFKISKLKNLKIKHLAIVLLAGVLMLMLSNLSPKTTYRQNKKEKTKTESIANDDIEKRLSSIIGKIKGVSDVSVLITYENNGVHKTDFNIKESTKIDDGSTDVTRESSAIMQKKTSDEEPFVSEEKTPEVRGVLIVAKGVGSPGTNAKITEAVSAVLGVAVHKVKILQAD